MVFKVGHYSYTKSTFNWLQTPVTRQQIQCLPYAEYKYKMQNGAC